MGRREKKIDFLLSIAGFWQLCVIGTSGALYTVIFQSEIDITRVLVLGLFDTVSFIALFKIWFKTHKRLKK